MADTRKPSERVEMKDNGDGTTTFSALLEAPGGGVEEFEMTVPSDRIDDDPPKTQLVRSHMDDFDDFARVAIVVDGREYEFWEHDDVNHEFHKTAKGNLKPGPGRLPDGDG